MQPASWNSIFNQPKNNMKKSCKVWLGTSCSDIKLDLVFQVAVIVNLNPKRKEKDQLET